VNTLLKDALTFFISHYRVLALMFIPVVGLEFATITMAGLGEIEESVDLTSLQPTTLALLLSTFVVLEPLVSGLTCRFVYRARLQSTGLVSTVYKDVFSIAPVLILLQLSILLGVVVGIQLFIIPGLIVWYLCSLAIPVLCRDRVGVFEALRLSWRYTKEGFNQYFPNLVLLIVAVVIPLNLLSLINWPSWVVPLWMLATTVAMSLIDVYKCRVIDHLNEVDTHASRD
jgi:hypothetical protein